MILVAIYNSYEYITQNQKGAYFIVDAYGDEVKRKEITKEDAKKHIKNGFKEV